MQARHTRININYEGHDITQDISPYILTFTFNDNSTDKADDISLTLEDRTGLWFNDYAPSKSDKITCSIIISEDGKTERLPCGTFQVDQIEYRMPPRILSIKAISTSITSGMRDENHSQAWENTSISGICNDIAGRNSLTLYFDAQDYQVSRREQIQKPDIEFISTLCKDYGLAVKVRDGKLIVYDEKANEESESVCELSINDSKIISCSFTSKSSQVYKKAKVKYHDSIKNVTHEGEYEDEDEEGSERTLEIREYAESSGDASRIAESRLYDANRKEVTGSITLRGDIRFSGGQNILLSEFGIFGGKYTITKATHKIDSSGYTTTLELGETCESKGSTKEHKAKRSGKKSKATPSAELFYEGTKYYGYKGDSK